MDKVCIWVRMYSMYWKYFRGGLVDVRASSGEVVELVASHRRGVVCAAGAGCLSATTSLRT